jgi:hypothetical protein
MGLVDRAPDAFAFGEKLLTLLDEAAVSTTYKYALLLAIIDLCMERTGASGDAPRSTQKPQTDGPAERVAVLEE